MNSKSLLYWVMTFLIIYALWPILKWLIFIIIVLLVALFFYLKSKTKVFTNIKWDDGTINKDYYETIDNNRNDDVIDVEYKEKEQD